jgi:hypothetical protein
MDLGCTPEAPKGPTSRDDALADKAQQRLSSAHVLDLLKKARPH